MEFEELMRELGAKLGLSHITVEDGTAAIEIDSIPFGFIYDKTLGLLTIAVDIGQQPEGADSPLGSAMLKANFLYEMLGGAVFFQNPENDAFGIEQRFRLVDLDTASLYDNVERLANTAEEWRDFVAGYGQMEAVAKKQQAEHQENPFAPSDFMRV